jgi:iron complex transport system substrate-binding protein
VKHTLMVGLAAALVFAACGDDDDAASTAPPSETAAPTATTGAATSAPAAVTSAPAATTPAPTASSATTEPSANLPQRIVSLSPTHTEMLFAIGAGDQVVAVDDQSDFPEAALAVQTALSGFEPNVEAIAGYEPDLVVISNDGGLVAQLDDLGLETYLGPAAATLGDAYTQIEQLGALTGHVGEAAEVVGQMETDIASLTTDVPELAQPLSVYHELDPTFFSVTSSTFIGQIYSMFGLRNIADETEDSAGGYPQLNQEFIVSNDPHIIFLADSECCQQDAASVAARDGWSDLSAVTNGLVFSMSDDIASRWGPRTVDYVRDVRAAVAQAAALQPAG